MYISQVSGERLQDHWSSGFSQFDENKKQQQQIPITAENNSSIHCEIQSLLFEIVFNSDYKLLLNDSK